MSEEACVRAFLAVPPDPAWSEGGRALLAALRPRLPDASWTRPESWHVTLRFLGDLSRRALADFSAAIARAAAGRTGSDFSVAGPAVFPDRGPARVLGVELDGGPALADLAREAEAAARAAGSPAEKRPFRPHVTFARLRRPWPASAVALFREETRAWRFPVWPVRACVLYESRLTSEGAIHTRVGEWALPAPEGVSA